MPIKTQSDIVTVFTQYLQARFPLIDVTVNRALASLLFDGYATELAEAYQQLQQVQIDQGASNPEQATTEGLDGLAFNWNLTRRGSVAATGIITFQRATQPTTTIAIGAQDGSGAITVSTSRQATGTVVSFTTTETVYLTSSSTLNPVTGFYEVEAPVTCLSLGAIGNVDAGLLNTLQSSIPGVDAVVNKISTTGGREEESNTDLARRIAEKVQGLQPGISKGLTSIALSQDNVIDAVVVTPNDSEFTRAGTGGAVDLLILGEELTSSVQFDTYTTNQPFVVLTNRPATSISAVVAYVGLTQTTLTSGVDYSFSQDLVSASALSAESNDQLSWLSARQPNNNTTVTIQYQYDKVIPAIQTIVDEDDNHFVTASVLVKRATRVLVDISLTVRKASGYNSTTVSNNVASALSNLVNNLGLGAEVQQSDLVLAVKTAPGVQSVVLPVTKLAERGLTGVADITPSKYEYCRIDSSSLLITVV